MTTRNEAGTAVITLYRFERPCACIAASPSALYCGVSLHAWQQASSRKAHALPVPVLSGRAAGQLAGHGQPEPSQGELL